MFTLDKRIVLEKIFPYITDKTQFSKLKIDYDFITHVTSPLDAKKICTIISKHIAPYKNASDSMIVDATGGAGCDTLAFSKCFSSVVSIEIDPTKYEYIKNNVDIYNCKNVHVINGNSIDIIPKIQHVDIIYVDPPWGGKVYKEYDLIRLSLGNVPIEDLTKTWFATDYSPKCIVFKLPKNYDLRHFFDSLNNQTIPQFKVFLYEIRKLFILVVEKNDIDIPKEIGVKVVTEIIDEIINKLEIEQQTNTN